MAFETKADKAVYITYGRGTNDIEIVNLKDTQLGKGGNGSHAKMDSSSDVEGFITAVSTYVDAVALSYGGALRGKDATAVRGADDATSVSSVFTIKHPTDSTFPPINIYVPKILKKTKVADFATALKALVWVKADGVTSYGATNTVNVSYKAVV